jgi:hypothetical protein
MREEAGEMIDTGSPVIALYNAEQKFRAQAKALRQAANVLRRLYPYIEDVNHFHLADGTILYASAVWDVLALPEVQEAMRDGV